MFLYILLYLYTYTGLDIPIVKTWTNSGTVQMLSPCAIVNLYVDQTYKMTITYTYIAHTLTLIATELHNIRAS